MDDVQVHYNSSKPAGLQAFAYTDGKEIHVGPRQDKYLPHEAWHVVQQAQGRVKPTAQAMGVPINNEPSLEREAETMGNKATVHAKRGERRRNNDAKPVRGKAAARHSPARTSLAVCRGEKYGLRTISQLTEIGTEGLELLIAAQGEYKEAMREKKKKAMAAFKGKEGDANAQLAFSRALQKNEMTLNGLLRFLDRRDFKVKNDMILYKDQAVAEHLRDMAAYEKISEPIASQSGEFVQSAVYKRHRLVEKNPEKPKEYVLLNRSMVRRYAERGITPPELKDLKAGEHLVPLKWANRTEGSTGYSFNQLGVMSPREEKSDIIMNDLAFLNSLRDFEYEELKQIPDDLRLLAFLQTRKGVNKAFSATSTDKPITSNAGGSFSEHGKIQIDLAKVPENLVLHQYNAMPFQQQDFEEGLASTKMQAEIERANETVTRNREIVLSKIPRGAITKFVTKEGREVPFGDVEDKFKQVYTQKYKSEYSELLGKAGSKDKPPEAEIPIRYHFSLDKAKEDAMESAPKAAKRDFLAKYNPQKPVPEKK